MSGAVFNVDAEVLNLDAVDSRLAKLSHLDLPALLAGIGAELESQTRRRIQDEKTSPEGHEWTPWSDKYSETRHQNQSLLISEGDLLDSIQFETDSFEVAVGSNKIYAATHQYGDPSRNIVDRPYLGLSAENEADLVRLTVDFLDEHVR